MLTSSEYFHECYCGNNLATGGVPANPGDCSTPCVGDPTEPCGGGNRLSLFWSGRAPPEINPGVNSYSPIGCYVEGTTGRALAYQALPPAGTEMSVSVCTSSCRAIGYSFAGLENGEGKIDFHVFH